MSHQKRPALSYRNPVHVVLRLQRGIYLRNRKMYAAIRLALLAVLEVPDFRVIHFSIQRNHLHMIVEARSETALSEGMHKLAIHCARKINAAAVRTGTVFATRYHATQILDARQARNAIAYVLNNWRRHREDLQPNGKRRWEKVDRYSSGFAFGDWNGRPELRMPRDYQPLPVHPPQTALLESEWQWFGLIDPWEVPGPTSV